MKFKVGAIGWVIPWTAESLHLWWCPLGPAAGRDPETSVLHTPPVLYYSKFTLTFLIYHERQWEITSRWGRIWGKRFKSCSPFLPHACVYVSYQSFHRDTSCLTFSCYTHSCCSCIQLCYRKQMLWHLSTPSDVNLPSSLCGVIVCWVLEAEVLPSLLTRMLTISSVLPNACACEL